MPDRDEPFKEALSDLANAKWRHRSRHISGAFSVTWRRTH
jgi:hypothetical protein